MEQIASVSLIKLIRDMDASEIEIYAHEMRIGRIKYDLMADIELDKQYKQLTDRNYIESPSDFHEKEMRAYLKSCYPTNKTNFGQ